MIDCAALVACSPIALPLGKFRQRAERHASVWGSFTKAKSASEDVLQSSKMIRHGPADENELQNSTASNVKKEARICIGMQDGIPDDQRSRRLSPARRTQAVRTRHQRRDPLHQGDRQVALSPARARPLGVVGTGASGRHADRRAAAGRGRQPGRAFGLEPARIRLRAGIDERGQRARARAPAARRGDGRGGALPQPRCRRQPGQRRQRRGVAGRTGLAR